MILITGGAGFIGSNFILDWLEQSNESIVDVDKLTYAGNLENLSQLKNDSRHIFIKGDIGDKALMEFVFKTYKPRAVINLAAESHVDRSIFDPTAFFCTNVIGTLNLIEVALNYWKNLLDSEKAVFRFLHVSTDEVYGSLGLNDAPFTEDTKYAPNSPYSASKASSDHIVRAYYHTYGLPTIITNCSNNYGPRQYPEKLIPLMINNALAKKPLPVYGDGLNIRDWIFVSDHCAALRSVLEFGRPGEAYNIGSFAEKKNIDIVKMICELLDTIYPDSSGKYSRFITYVTDRLGHDRRYCVDNSKIKKELGWEPVEKFETGITKTIKWYIDAT
jgi:dTDP-glucose 4,6-dehydratase